MGHCFEVLFFEKADRVVVRVGYDVVYCCHALLAVFVADELFESFHEDLAKFLDKNPKKVKKWPKRGTYQFLIIRVDNKIDELDKAKVPLKLKREVFTLGVLLENTSSEEFVFQNLIFTVFDIACNDNLFVIGIT